VDWKQLLSEFLMYRSENKLLWSQKPISSC